MSGVTAEEYIKYFQGFNISDCVVRKKDIFYLVVKQAYNTAKDAPSEFSRVKRVLPCFLNKPRDDRWSRSVLNKFDHLCGGVTAHPIEQFVGVDLSGAVYVIGSGDHGVENPILGWREGGPDRGGIRKTRTIQGYLYAVGGGRTCIRREQKNLWHGFTKDIPNGANSDDGFDDIDGFSTSDLYCIGGAGDVWHFNGEKWKQCAFPSNVYLESVCCAGDGFVYIGGQSGVVFKGRGDEWKRIHKDNMSLPFKDMVWYQGKVWCTSDYGLWVIENDKLKEADVPAEVRACSGNLSVGDGVMLLAGIFGAAYHDGSNWQILVATQNNE